eukprot:CAMPEP_0171064312 /NCGR_PEP_ID=MMETSP0766_2-20121228/6204_1 /TAXON_ID=439317 /ORGANISM="Gambierdiscus australes, Strain CAWD 149" /LENGTH=794 /DNA_ID=CAMNT_0011520333 /DNA_START=57 /DNA_END=2441 /DNA_ORIENTATION=-
MKYLTETGCGDVIEKGDHLYKLHDFGVRGASSLESAALGGSAHLVNFMSTDTLPATVLAREFYADTGVGLTAMPGNDHGVVTSWGREREADAYRHLMEQFPRGSVVCVSDSYDICSCCEQILGTELKTQVEHRKGTLVVRSDSGKLPAIVLQVLEKLGAKFGTTTTNTGHKKLPECLRVLQSDGIDINTVDNILRAMKSGGWAADNLAFGSGGALLQKLHRDTLKCAFKCSWVKIAGEGQDVSKDPVTDSSKRSKLGKLTLELRNGKYQTVVGGEGELENNVLKEVFRDGRLLIDNSFQSVRERTDGADPKVPPSEPQETFSGLEPFHNILMLADAFKLTTHMQFPPGIETVYSYFESRGGIYDEVCFFGLQYFIKKYLTGPVVTQERIDKAYEHFKVNFSTLDLSLGEKVFNRSGWEHILREHGGYLPMVIKSVPEGTVLPNKNVLFTLENTDPKCYWLTSHLESLLVEVWFMTTVATQSREQKKVITKYLKETGAEDVVKQNLHLFKLHDFGLRGTSSPETAATGGAAHLINFLGSDTMPALVMLKQYYGADCAGFSIPASEHSTITSWGKEKELNAFRNMLEQYPTGILACVSDSYDIFNACEQYWGTDLKDLIAKREGVLVVRPDSGELPKTLLQVLEKLESKFGSTTSSTGHKLLPPYLRVIQGDGIDSRSVEKILQALKDNGWSADNVAFGSGGALLQKLHRDMLKFAMKCSCVVVNGESVDISKEPVTDPSKVSRKGRLTLERRGEEWVTVERGEGDPSKDELVEVYRDGRLVVDDSLEEIRKRAEI